MPLRNKALLLILCLLFAGCGSVRDGQNSAADSSAKAAPTPAAETALSALPALDSLPASDSTRIGRKVSDLSLELLSSAPSVDSGSPSAQYSAGSLVLSPAGTGSLAWAIFSVSGLDADGSAIPLSLSVSATEDYYLALSDYGSQSWRLMPRIAGDSYTIADGSNLVSPAGNFHVALLAWESPASFSSLQLITNQATPPAPEPLLGINMEALGSVSVGWTFLDLMRISDPWQSVTPGGQPNATPLDLDANGWVRSLAAGQAANCIFLRNEQGYYPAGQYVCLYEGQGSLLFLGDASIASSQPGRIIIDLAPGSNGNRAGLRLSATEPADYVRNIRIVPLAHEADYAGQIFSPEFLANLAPFEVVRFLNWNRANNSPVTTAADLTPVDYQTQAVPGGAAPELMCELCNRLQAGLWINIPHQADDSYVTALADSLRDNLDPELQVYIEHSNEVWSDGFAQGPYCEDQGVSLGLSNDPFTARIRFHSQRSVHIFDLFEQSFGGTERLVRVMGAAHFNAFTVTEVLDWQNAWQNCDAVCTAPYIGGRLGRDPDAPQVRDMSIPEVINEMSIDSSTSASMTLTNSAAAKARGVRYFAYEGGQALYAQGSYSTDNQLTGLFNAVNRDPAMRQLYLDHLNRWHDNGGGLFMAFSYIGRYDNYGNWGLFENQQQDPQTAHKYQGLLDYIAQFP